MQQQSTGFGSMGLPKETVDAFYLPFQGRNNAWGGDDGLAIWQPVTRTLVANHLTGVQGIGIYPIRQRTSETDPLMVRWGCCDIDTGDWAEAYRLGVALNGMGLEPWVERSRSKGWHIWVFASDWVEAWEMRRALKVAYAAIDLRAKEANPKSERLRVDQLGNYVRLPYKGWFDGSRERQVFMTEMSRTSDGRPLSFDEFVSTPKGVDPNVVKHWATKWFEPVKQVRVSVEDILSDDAVMVLAGRMDSRTRIVWEGGPKNADRSATLQALGHAFAKQGFTPQENFQLVAAADRMWGKYHERANGEYYIADIVERCYL